MKTNHYSAEQIIKILEQAEKGEQSVGSVCREHGVWFPIIETTMVTNIVVRKAEKV